MSGIGYRRDKAARNVTGHVLTVICPDCNGTGEVVIAPDDPVLLEPWREDCPFCDATGVIPEPEGDA